MSKPTVIQIEARGNEGDSSSRARVLIANQPWVRRSAGCDAAARAAAAKFFEVPEDLIRLTAPFSGIYSAFIIRASSLITPWRFRRSPAAAVPDMILIEARDQNADPIGMVHETAGLIGPALGTARAALISSAPDYHITVGQMLAGIEASHFRELETFQRLIQIYNHVEAEFSKVQKTSTGGES